MLFTVHASALALLTAGSVTTPPADPTPIYGGERTDGYPAVVSFQAGSGFCTGTVVAPRLVLTAGHCLAGFAPGSTTITIYYGPEAFLQSQSVDAVSWGTHPEFCSKTSCGDDIHDLGYLTLPSDFVVQQYPSLIVDQQTWDESMTPGTVVTLVGYGEADNDPGAPNSGNGIKREVDVTIDHLTPKGLEFFAGGDGKDTCRGDSGGPAFVTLDDGTLALAGILSRGSDPCGEGGFYGAPYAGLCWVRDETGVDLVPSGCADCACLDTAPPPEGCGCTTDPAGAPLHWSGLAVLAMLSRRRR